MVLSTAEAEYVAAESCCAQVFWIKQQMKDLGLYFDYIPINCDNTSAINLSKNPIQHSRTNTLRFDIFFTRSHSKREY